MPEAHSKLIIEVHEGSLGPIGQSSMRHVGIAGNKQGLIDLATAILSLAESPDDSHIHLDDVYKGIVDSPEGFWLTIAKIKED